MSEAEPATGAQRDHWDATEIDTSHTRYDYANDHAAVHVQNPGSTWLITLYDGTDHNSGPTVYLKGQFAFRTVEELCSNLKDFYHHVVTDPVIPREYLATERFEEFEPGEHRRGGASREIGDLYTVSIRPVEDSEDHFEVILKRTVEDNPDQLYVQQHIMPGDAELATTLANELGTALDQMYANRHQ